MLLIGGRRQDRLRRGRQNKDYVCANEGEDLAGRRICLCWKVVRCNWQIGSLLGKEFVGG